jgi:hypothetical protein
VLSLEQIHFLLKPHAFHFSLAEQGRTRIIAHPDILEWVLFVLEPAMSLTMASKPLPNVLLFADCDRPALSELLDRFGLKIEVVAKSLPIPGSFWGDEEAGLIADRLLVRADTPVHSILHEACHFICMDHQRREGLHTNAGGDYDEENAVCYLQILLSASLPEMGQQRMFADMDQWGYSFRLGSARAWFNHDADDARQWLQRNGILDTQGSPSLGLRS